MQENSLPERKSFLRGRVENGEKVCTIKCRAWGSLFNHIQSLRGQKYTGNVQKPYPLHPKEQNKPKSAEFCGQEAI